MQAVIMAGGQGTRLRELTKNKIPKPMIEIAGKPLLQWQIENLKENGIDDIIIVVGHLGDLILNKFGNTVRYFEEDTPLGTAGALPKIANLLDDNFFLIYGDLFFNIDLQRMINFHNQHKGEGTLFIHPNSHPYDSDLIQLDTDNRIKQILFKNEFREKWQHNCTNAGIYLFNKSILNIFPNKEKIDMEKEVLPHLQYLYGYSSSEYVKDIGTIDRFYQVQNDINNGLPLRRNLKNKQKAIFLDRDGTINQEVGLVYKTSQLELESRAADAIKRINNSDYLAIVITNQPVIAKGLCELDDLERIHNKLETLLGQYGAFVNAIYYCPHHPKKGFEGENVAYKIKCECRKPGIELFTRAAAQFNIDLTQSWMIGDRDVDILAGQNIGAKTILLHNDLPEISPTYKANDLYDAINLILGD